MENRTDLVGKDLANERKIEQGQNVRSVVTIFFKNPAVIIICLLLIILFGHPKLLNLHLYFRFTAEPAIHMNFVSSFYLWTRRKSTSERLTAGAIDDLKMSSFEHRKTYFIIHGFTRNGLDRWIIRIKNALLWRENCNVISVDWEAGSVTAGYYVIQARVPLVGEDVAKMIIFLLENTRLTYQNVHLIGHSLGAHIAGFTGKYLNGTLQRITGLDPASLGYNGASKFGRLDTSDAHFVDVIHTHGCYAILNQWRDCYGTYDNIGDADFWPNGGEHQPACDDDGDGPQFVPEGSNCDHAMSYVYYAESIKFYPTSTRFLSRLCPSWEHFNNGSCPCRYPPQYMGYNVSPSSSGVFFLNTSKTRPYGVLEPNCPSAQYSFLKILGIAICTGLLLIGLVSSALTIMTVCGHPELTMKFKSTLGSFSLPKNKLWKQCKE